jgi:hypothetical protein
LTRMIPRLALIGTCVLGVSGLVAGPAEAANNYVTQPVVTGATLVTPESAVVSGAIDTGGDEGVNFPASGTNPYYFGGLTITSNSTLNGIPIGPPNNFYSTALFEADPLSDYIASGDNPGADTVTAPVVEVPTTTGLSPVSSEVGAYPADAAGFGSEALTPNTKYIYWIIQQAGESQEATTVNEYNSADLANWAAGSGSITTSGFASSSSVTSSNDYNAWAAGTGSFAGDPKDPSKVPASLINPDYACVLNSTIAANTNSTWAAELAANQVPTAAGTTTLNGTALPYGINTASHTGSFTAASGPKPAEQGPCVTFYGGNSTNFYQSGFGTFTTPPLGKIVVGGKGTVSHGKAMISVKVESVESGAGSIVLTKGGKKIASGKFKVPAGATGTENLKLTKAGAALFKVKKIKKTKHHHKVTIIVKPGKVVAKVSLTSTTDQPGSGKSVTLVPAV